MPSCNEALIDRERREQSTVLLKDIDTDMVTVEEYWKLIFKDTYNCGKPMFENLRKVLEFMHSLPFSNVTVKRLFSVLSDVKAEIRSSFSNISVASILQTKMGMKRLDANSSSLIVNLEMTKMLSSVKANATAAEAATIISRPPI